MVTPNSVFYRRLVCNCSQTLELASTKLKEMEILLESTARKSGEHYYHVQSLKKEVDKQRQKIQELESEAQRHQESKTEDPQVSPQLHLALILRSPWTTIPKARNHKRRAATYEINRCGTIESNQRITSASR